MAVLKTATERTKREREDAKEHNGDDHRKHPRNILSRSTDDEPCGGQRENKRDQVNVSRCVRNRFHAHHLTRQSSATAGESELGLQWTCFHNFVRCIATASGSLQRFVRRLACIGGSGSSCDRENLDCLRIRNESIANAKLTAKLHVCSEGARADEGHSRGCNCNCFMK